jgi:hypothetical protein
VLAEDRSWTRHIVAWCYPFTKANAKFSVPIVAVLTALAVFPNALQCKPTAENEEKQGIGRWDF